MAGAVGIEAKELAGGAFEHFVHAAGPEPALAVGAPIVEERALGILARVVQEVICAAFRIIEREALAPRDHQPTRFS